MHNSKKQLGMALMEGLLVIFLIAVIVVAGIYVKNRNSKTTEPSTQSPAAAANYKSIATDPAKQGTVSSIEAAVNGGASDEAQAEQQSENSQSQTASSDSSDANNVGDTVNENQINF